MQLSFCEVEKGSEMARRRVEAEGVAFYMLGHMTACRKNLSSGGAGLNKAKGGWDVPPVHL